MNGLNWFEWLSLATSTAVLDYGAPALALAFFFGALGLPMPGTVLVLGAGALAQQGHLDGGQTLAFALAGVVLGDSLSYALGRWAGSQGHAKMAQRPVWQNASSAFARHGAWLVFFSRWLLTPLALPVNWLAGSRIAFGRFLVYDAAGEFTWLMLYGSLGYLLGSRAAALADYLSTFSLWLLVLLAAILALAWLVRAVWLRQPDRAKLHLHPSLPPL